MTFLPVVQIWIDGRDASGMLTRIGSWWVDCDYHREHAAAVEWAEEQGYVTRRTHYSPATPKGQEAFELTDLGLDRVGEWWGPAAQHNATRSRQWYRDNTSQPLKIEGEQ